MKNVVKMGILKVAGALMCVSAFTQCEQSSEVVELIMGEDDRGGDVVVQTISFQPMG